MAPLDNSWYEVRKRGKYQKLNTVNETKDQKDPENIINNKVNNKSIDNSKEAIDNVHKDVKKSSLKSHQQWTIVQKKKKKKKVRFNKNLYTNSTDFNNKPGGEKKKQTESELENVFKSNKFIILENENDYDKFDEILYNIEYQIDKISEIEDDINKILKMSERPENSKAKADSSMSHLPDHPTRNGKRFQCSDCFAPGFAFFYPNDKALTKYLQHMEGKHGIPAVPAKAYYDCFIRGTSRKFVPEVAQMIQKDMNKSLSLVDSQELNRALSLLAGITVNEVLSGVTVNDSTTNSPRQ